MHIFKARIIILMVFDLCSLIPNIMNRVQIEDTKMMVFNIYHIKYSIHLHDTQINFCNNII